MNEPAGDLRTLPPARRDPGLFTILADPRAYKALTFLLAAPFTGPYLFAWAALVATYSLDISLLIAGIAAALLCMAALKPLVWLDGRMTGLLLDSPVSHPRASAPYLLLRLPLGLLYFLLGLICLLLPSAFLWAGLWAVSGQVTAYPPDPFLADEPFWRGLLSGQFVHETAGTLHVHGAPQWLGLQAPLLPGSIALAVGILLFVPLLHLVHAVGQWHGRLAQRMLS